MMEQAYGAVRPVSMTASLPAGQISVEQSLDATFFWLRRSGSVETALHRPSSMYRDRSFDASSTERTQKATFVAVVDDDGEW